MVAHKLYQQPKVSTLVHPMVIIQILVFVCKTIPSRLIINVNGIGR